MVGVEGTAVRHRAPNASGEGGQSTAGAGVAGCTWHYAGGKYGGRGTLPQSVRRYGAVVGSERRHHTAGV